METKYTDKAREVLKQARKTAQILQLNYVGTEHILISLVKTQQCVASRILQDNGVSEERLMNMIRDLIVQDGAVATLDADGFSPRAQKVLEEAERLSKRFHADRIGTEHILLALIKEGENVALRLISTMGVQIQKVYAETLSAMGEDPSLVKEDLGQQKSGGKKKGSVLEKYSRDLTALAEEGKLDPVIGREAEIRRVVQILSRRTKNNPCYRQKQEAAHTGYFRNGGRQQIPWRI